MSSQSRHTPKICDIRLTSAVEQAKLYKIYDDSEYKTKADILYNSTIARDKVFFCISKRLFRYLRSKPYVVPPLLSYWQNVRSYEIYKPKTLPLLHLVIDDAIDKVKQILDGDVEMYFRDVIKCVEEFCERKILLSHSDIKYIIYRIGDHRKILFDGTEDKLCDKYLAKVNTSYEPKFNTITYTNANFIKLSVFIDPDPRSKYTALCVRYSLIPGTLMQKMPSTQLSKLIQDALDDEDSAVCNEVLLLDDNSCTWDIKLNYIGIVAGSTLNSMISLPVEYDPRLRNKLKPNYPIFEEIMQVANSDNRRELLRAFLRDFDSDYKNLRAKKTLTDPVLIIKLLRELYTDVVVDKLF